jgi:hypothetical protein
LCAWCSAAVADCIVKTKPSVAQVACSADDLTDISQPQFSQSESLRIMGELDPACYFRIVAVEVILSD